MSLSLLMAVGSCKTPEEQGVLIRVTCFETNKIYFTNSPYDERSECKTLLR